MITQLRLQLISVVQYLFEVEVTWRFLYIKYWLRWWIVICKCLQNGYTNKCDLKHWWHLHIQISVFDYKVLAMGQYLFTWRTNKRLKLPIKLMMSIINSLLSTSCKLQFTWGIQIMLIFAYSSFIKCLKQWALGYHFKWRWGIWEIRKNFTNDHVLIVGITTLCSIRDFKVQTSKAIF